MPRMKREIVRPNRWKLLARRQRRNLKLAGLALLGFAVVLIGVSLVHSAQSGGTVAELQKRFGSAIDLRVQDIRIDGRSNTPELLLRAALGVSKGDPLLGFSVEGARRRIETLSWVEHVAVERRLPGTIYVDLTERRPFAIWQFQGKFQLIDRAGQVVTDEDIASFTDLPLVVGSGAPAHASDMLNILAASPDLHARVAAIVRVGERRWNLQLKNHLTVMLPEGHEAAALSRLSVLQAQQKILDRPLVFVDMRLPDRLAVRTRTPIPGADPKLDDPRSNDSKPGDARPDIAPQRDPASRRAT